MQHEQRPNSVRSGLSLIRVTGKSLGQEGVWSHELMFANCWREANQGAGKTRRGDDAGPAMARQGERFEPFGPLK